MKISFACPRCAKPLVADTALAGRTGRCRSCGQRTVVPGVADGAGNPSASADWRTAVTSQLPANPGHAAVANPRADVKPAADTSGGYTLRPVTPVNVPALAASDWDNAELGPAIALPPKVFTSPATAVRPPSRTAGSRVAGPRVGQPRAVAPTAAASPASANIVTLVTNIVAPLMNAFTPGAARSASNGAAPALVAYRSFFGLLGRLTAWISETSYTVSFILIILAVASGMIGRHSLATMVCGAIVALNLIGLAGDLASLVTLSFRKNPLQGGLFLVPPFTLYYLWTDWQRYRDTVLRMRIPLVTLALVAAAYAYVPWLRGGIKAEVPAVESVEKAVGAVEEELAGQKGILDEGLKKARSWLREVPLPDPSSLPGSQGTPKPDHGRKP